MVSKHLDVVKTERVQVNHIAHARCNNGAVAVFLVFNSGLYNVIKLFYLRYKLAGDKSIYFQSANA